MCYHREWAIAAKLGLALKKLPDSLTQRSELSVLLFIGAFHYGLVKKLKSLGIATSIPYNADSVRDSGVRNFAKVIAKTTFTIESGRQYALFIDKFRETLGDRR